MARRRVFRATHLTRSALYRCIQRHGISRLPEVEEEKPKRKKFKRYPSGFFHIEIAAVQTAEGKLYCLSALTGLDLPGKSGERLPHFPGQLCSLQTGPFEAGVFRNVSLAGRGAESH